MRYKNLSGVNFGKFKEIIMDFSSGLNVVYGRNGAGKSTIASMLKTLLYSFPQSRKPSVSENERKRMTPWGTSEDLSLRGTIEADNGKCYTVERTFGRVASKDTLKVYEEGSLQESKELSSGVGEGLLEMDESAFLRTSFFPQGGTPIDKSENLTKKLMNLVSSADEKISPADALSLLDAERKALDNSRGMGKIPDLLREREELLSKKRDAAAKREKNLENLERLRELEDLILQSEEALSKNKTKVSDAENIKDARLYKKYLELLSGVKKCDETLIDLQKQITANGELIDMSYLSSLEEDVLKAEAKFSISKNQEEYYRDLKRDFDEKQEELSHASVLLKDGGIDTMVSRLNTARQENEKKIKEYEEQKEIVDQKNSRIAEIHALHKEFAKLSDEEGKELLDMADNAESEKKSGLFASALFLVFAALCGGGAYFLNLNGYDKLLTFAALALCGLFVLIFFVWIYFRLRKYDNQMEELANLMKIYGAEDIDEFETLFSQSRKEKYECELLEKEVRESRLSEKEAEARETKAEIAELDESLQKLIQDNHFTSVGELLDAVNVAKEKKIAAEALRKQLFNMELDLEKNVKEAKAAAFAAVSRARTLSPASDTLQDVRKLIIFCKEIFSSIKQELLKSELYEKEIADLSATNDLKKLKAAYDLSELRGEELLPDGEVTDDSEKIFRRLSDLKSEKAALISEIREPSLWGGEMPEYDEELERISRQLENLKIRLEAVMLAIQKINEAFSELEQSFAPKLLKSFSENMEEIIGERESAIVDKNFEIKILKENSLRDIGYFSKGITDAVYFALRLSLTEISEGEKICPLVLDDTFSDMDDKNFEAAISLIKGEAKRRQVIFFTCQKREYEALKQIGAREILLS